LASTGEDVETGFVDVVHAGHVNDERGRYGDEGIEERLVEPAALWRATWQRAFATPTQPAPLGSALGKSGR
jgi:hypothetical protein